MVLGLESSLGPLDAHALQIRAQAGKRPFVEKAGKIIGSVGQELAAANADEEMEEFPLGLLLIGPGCRSAKRSVCDAERRRIACQVRQAPQEVRVRSLCEQPRQQGIFGSAGTVDGIDRSCFTKKE